MTVEISVIICSHNREDLIANSIDSLANQNLEKWLYEIIIVDNASTDSTKQVVFSKAEKIPNLYYTMEPTLGLSCARNTGFQKATGKYVAFIDDDGIADKSWLKNIIKAFEQHQEVGVVGGKVSPIWSKPPAHWIKKELLDALSLLDWSDVDTFLEPWHWLCGVNIAYRKELLEKYGGFCPQLGRKGKTLISNEEVYLNKRIIEDGFKVFYSPDIFVQHFIPEERLEKKWFFSRFYWQGRSDATMDWERVRSRKKYLNLILLNFKQVFSENILKIWFSELEIYNKVLVWRKIGYLRGAVPILLRSLIFGHRI